MSWGAVAVGVGTVAAGALSSRASSRSADRATDAAEAMSAEELAFAKEQYQDWKNLYGPLEENLAGYYQTLTPEARIARGIEMHELEMQRARKNIRENLSQRGIATSGIAAQIDTELAISSAEERARIRADAPMETAREQAAFLQIGLNQNPRTELQNTLRGQTQSAAAAAIGAQQQSSAADQALIAAGFDAFEGVVSAFQNSRAPKLEPVPTSHGSASGQAPTRR